MLALTILGLALTVVGIYLAVYYGRRPRRRSGIVVGSGSDWNLTGNVGIGVDAVVDGDVDRLQAKDNVIIRRQEADG
jgi:hypothetical protein